MGKKHDPVGAWTRCFENARFLADIATEQGHVEFQDAVWKLTRFVTLVKFLHVEFARQRDIAPGQIAGEDGMAARNQLSRHGIYARLELAGCSQDMLEDEKTTLDDLVKNNTALRDIVAVIEDHRKTTIRTPGLPHRWPLSPKSKSSKRK